MINKETSMLDPSRIAMERVYTAFGKLKEKYANFNLEHLFETVRNRAIDCEDLQCSCFSVKENVKNLTELIDYNMHLFRKTQAYKKLTSEADPLDAAPIVDPFNQSIDDEKIRKIHRGVKTETLENFYKRVNEDGLLELSNDENRTRDGHKNCLAWMQFHFPQISQGGVKRIAYKLGGGNYVATAIYCFLVENRIDERPEFKELWDKVQPCPKHWLPKMHKRISHAYCRDRKRNFISFVPDRSSSKYLDRRYTEIAEAWKKDYPNLFEAKSFHLNQDAVTNSDPGEIFECTHCKLKYPKKFAVSCIQTDIVDSALPHVHRKKSLHYYCRKCCSTIPNEMKFDIVFCPEHGTCIQCLGTTADKRCQNTIATKEIHNYMEPVDRHNFNNTLVEKLVNRFEHVHLEKEDEHEELESASTQISLASLDAFTPIDEDASDQE
uniref:Uncharacterized protein n=1 Tax=Acrobeloides nanus TaxID=290746 RepID=A0A914DZK9_9BILA